MVEINGKIVYNNSEVAPLVGKTNGAASHGWGGGSPKNTTPLPCFFCIFYNTKWIITNIDRCVKGKK